MWKQCSFWGMSLDRSMGVGRPPYGTSMCASAFCARSTASGAERSIPASGQLFTRKSVVTAGDSGSTQCEWVQPHSSTISVPFWFSLHCLQTASCVCCNVRQISWLYCLKPHFFSRRRFYKLFSCSFCVRPHGSTEVPEVLCGGRPEARGQRYEVPDTLQPRRLHQQERPADARRVASGVGGTRNQW